MCWCFVALAVITALEVGVTYLPLPRAPVLVPMALAKAALVALFYMHLKYDRRIFGLVFAPACSWASGSFWPCWRCFRQARICRPIAPIFAYLRR